MSRTAVARGVVAALLLSGLATGSGWAGEVQTPADTPVIDTSPEPTGPPAAPDVTGFVTRQESLSGDESVRQAPGQTQVVLAADVLFEFGRADLTPAAAARLADVAARVNTGARGEVTVTGFTDSKGSDSVNLPLSQARAEAVRQALVGQVHTPGVTLVAQGRGAADPVAPNTNPDGSDNPAGRARNRRVEVTFQRVVASPTAAPVPSTASPVPSGAGVRLAATDLPAGITATVLSVRRIPGDLVALSLRVANDGTAGATSGVQVSLRTGDLPYNPPDLRGVTLVDRANDVRSFVVVSDAPEHFPEPFSSISIPAFYPGSAHVLWAWFPAPPPGTSTVQVDVPHFGLSSAVPVQG